MHTTGAVISHRFSELKGQIVIPSILMIHVQKGEYWLDIEICVLARQKV
jgi:hypothetical protein